MRFTGAPLLLLLGSTFLPRSTTPDEYRCTYTRRMVCTAEGCQPTPIGSAYLLVPHPTELALSGMGRLPGDPAVAVRRCDDRGCTPVEVEGHPSGAFMNVAAPTNGYLLKLAMMDEPLLGLRRGEFVEVATSMLATYTSYGRCAIPPVG